MIAVADASPLNYLIQIESDYLLHTLFGKVLIPTAVIDELRNPMAPRVVGSWVSRLPSWIEIRTAATAPDASLGVLDPGEREAIVLAQETHADLLLIDEERPSRSTKQRNYDDGHAWSSLNSGEERIGGSSGRF
jgi:predicted nucleic acid-binding protein